VKVSPDRGGIPEPVIARSGPDAVGDVSDRSCSSWVVRCRDARPGGVPPTEPRL